MNTEFSYRQEVYRKLIHLSSLWMILVMGMCSRIKAILIFDCFLLAVLLIEYARHYGSQSLRHFINRNAALLLRQHEKEVGLTGASYVLLAALLCVVLFPKAIAVTAFAMMIMGDTAAALVGRRFGKHPVFDKTWEGSAAFLLTALVVVMISHWVFGVPAFSWPMGLVGAVAATLAELSVGFIEIDDNLLVPLISGAAMSLVS